MSDFGFARRIVFSAATLSAWPALCAQTLAATDELNQPQISFETKYLKISLTIDAELQRFRELFASCLAEGKAWASKTNSDATAERHDNRKAFPWTAMVLRSRL